MTPGFDSCWAHQSGQRQGDSARRAGAGRTRTARTGPSRAVEGARRTPRTGPGATRDGTLRPDTCIVRPNPDAAPSHNHGQLVAAFQGCSRDRSGGPAGPGGSRPGAACGLQHREGVPERQGSRSSRDASHTAHVEWRLRRPRRYGTLRASQLPLGAEQSRSSSCWPSPRPWCLLCWPSRGWSCSRPGSPPDGPCWRPGGPHDGDAGPRPGDVHGLPLLRLPGPLGSGPARRGAVAQKTA